MSHKDEIVALFNAPFKRLNPGKALMVAIENNAERILDLNRQQLDRGLDSDGKSLGRYKNFKYKNRYQPVDLKLKGPFRDEFTITADETKSEIFSQNWKEPILEKRYGKKIHGIPQQMMPTMGDIIRPDFDREIKNQIVNT